MDDLEDSFRNIKGLLDTKQKEVDTINNALINENSLLVDVKRKLSQSEEKYNKLKASWDKMLEAFKKVKNV